MKTQDNNHEMKEFMIGVFNAGTDELTAGNLETEVSVLREYLGAVKGTVLDGLLCGFCAGLSQGIKIAEYFCKEGANTNDKD